jgi:hypothetical protein
MYNPSMTPADPTTSVTLAQEPVARATEMPELASMALLSVVLAGVSVMVRRAAPRSIEKPPAAPDRREASPAAGGETPTRPARSSPRES